MEQANQKTLTEEILDLWIKISGMDPDSTRIAFRFGDEFSIDAVREDLKQAFQLDESGLTALLMLDHFADEFFQHKSFSLAEMMSDTAPALELVAQSKQLKKLLQHEDIVSALKEFQKNMTTVLDALSAQEAAYEMLKDTASVGYVRRDAFKSMETLHCYQFAQGKPTSKNLHPVKDIFLFWDIPSVIRLGLTMPDCTFLGLVRDQNAYASFFVLVAKNGENLTVYTDCPEWTHPLQKNMTRRPGRELGTRICKHHFPYQLMDVELDYRGDAFIHQPKQTGLAVIQNKLEVIGSITELEPDETLWLIMILAMMDKALYKQNYHLPELSYCTEVLFEHSMLADVSQTLCLRRDGTKFELPVNTVESLAADEQFRGKDDEGEQTVFGTVNYHSNTWLEEKYKDKVPESAINGLLLPEQYQLAIDSGERTGVISREKAELEAMGYFKKREFEAAHPTLHTLSGNEFGSIQHLEENYRFIARYNEAAVINKLAAEDHKLHAPEVLKWFDTRVHENLQRLVLDLVQGWSHRNEDPDVEKRWGVWEIKHAKDGKFPYRLHWIFQGNNRTWADTLCALTGKAVSYAVTLNIKTLDDLMYATGCQSINEVPEWLHHWHKERLYYGNPILDRIDPMLWVVKDPWVEMDFDCLIFLSKTAIKSTCKKAGIQSSLFVPYEEKD